MGSRLPKDNACLPVLMGQKAFLQPGQIGEGFLRVDGNKGFPGRIMLGRQEEFQRSLPYPLHWQLGIQSETIVHRNNDPQAFPVFAAMDIKPAYHLARQLTAAMKPVVKPLPLYLHLAGELVSKVDAIGFLQCRHPLSLPYVDKAGTMRVFSPGNRIRPLTPWVFFSIIEKIWISELVLLKLSLVVPCYNEAENVGPFQEAVMAAFAGCGYDYEIVFINDGSKDATWHNLKKIHAAQKCPVKVISFSRNFGKEAGLYAGLQHASGEYISLIDADLQQRPEIVRDMVKILDEQPEYDVVAAYQDRRREGKVLSFFKKSFYAIINKLSDVTLQPDASDFRTFRRSVRDSILELPEYHRFSKGIFAWVGYDTCFIPYTACERAAGTTKWNFWKLLEYAVEGIIGYSTAPLRLATVLGTISGIGAVLYLIVVLLEKLIRGIDVPGYATIIVLILFFGSVQLFCIGIIGEYVGRTFEQGKNRPIYIAKEILSYEEKKEG